MPRDGSGGYQLPSGSWNPALNGNAATPNDWNLLSEDIRSAIQGSVAADGQTPIVGDLKMGNNRLTGLGSPSGDGQSLRFEQLKKGSDIASATTITIPREGALFDVTGTDTIETIDGSYPGRVVYLRTTDGCTFKRGAALIIPGGYDLASRAGAVVLAVAVENGVWLIEPFSEFGTNQTWQDVKASRSAGVAYTNTTGKPIAVSITISSSASATANLFVSGIEVAAPRIVLADARVAIFTLVPPSVSYILTVSGGTITFWAELR